MHVPGIIFRPGDALVNKTVLVCLDSMFQWKKTDTTQINRKKIEQVKERQRIRRNMLFKQDDQERLPIELACVQKSECLQRVLQAEKIASTKALRKARSTQSNLQIQHNPLFLSSFFPPPFSHNPAISTSHPQSLSNHQ